MGMPIKHDRMARYLEMIAPEFEEVTLDEMFTRMTTGVHTPAVEMTTGSEGRDGGDGIEPSMVTAKASYRRPESLRSICLAWDVPHGRILRWLMADTKRYAVYQAALEVQAHELIGEAVDISDEHPGYTDKGSVDAGAVAHAKLRIDTRFRLAGFHAKAMYGKDAEGGSGMTVVVDRTIGGTVTIDAQGAGTSSMITISGTEPPAHMQTQGMTIDNESE